VSGTVCCAAWYNGGNLVVDVADVVVQMVAVCVA
jgi:hypothetical protein